SYVFSDDHDMIELEDIKYSDDEDDVGAEADFNNLETSIIVSPIPTTRVYKDHPVTQIISDLSSATQTKSITRVAKDQGGFSQMFNDDFHTCMFACFLSQEEPMRVHQAHKDPSRIEAMQEELLQFKMQKVWVFWHMEKELLEEVYVCQPSGFEDPDHPDKVYKVVKALYGLHQAPRAWKFELTDGKSASTPIDTEKPLLKDPNGEDVDMHTYRLMIGSLIPDIMFAIYACARHQVTPKECHLHAVKRIFRYLKGYPRLGLWYPKESPFDLVAYSDSDYGGATQDRKSTTGGSQFLGRRLISWQCKKQTIVATSTTKAEYVAAASCCGFRIIYLILGIMVEEPKPMKKKQQVKLDEAYARKLHEELNRDIDWEVAIYHVKQKAKENPYVQRYQVIKKIPETEAQAQRNMMTYLKNTAGFRLDYFKGMSYDDIRPIFEAKFNANMEFLIKSKEQLEEEENRAIESINETPAQKATKRRRLNKEAEDVEELKQHLEIVPDEGDDVYTKATPLARKVPIVDYQVIHFNNKPQYKIIRADGTHQLYVSFINLLKNFDREDLELLWSLVKERFSTSKPNNFSDEYMLTILRAMFGRPDGQDQI
nr:uncharacterized mitochondrial protein AtMg00810-like [Tanacetum cinerariifolium]